MEEDEDGEQTGSRRLLKIVAGDEASSGQRDQNSAWNVQVSPPHPTSNPRPILP